MSVGEGMIIEGISFVSYTSNVITITSNAENNTMTISDCEFLGPSTSTSTSRNRRSTIPLASSFRSVNNNNNENENDDINNIHNEKINNNNKVNSKRDSNNIRINNNDNNNNVDDQNRDRERSRRNELKIEEDENVIDFENDNDGSILFYSTDFVDNSMPLLYGSGASSFFGIIFFHLINHLFFDHHFYIINYTMIN